MLLDYILLKPAFESIEFPIHTVEGKGAIPTDFFVWVSHLQRGPWLRGVRNLLATYLRICAGWYCYCEAFAILFQTERRGAFQRLDIYHINLWKATNFWGIGNLAAAFVDPCYIKSCAGVNPWHVAGKCLKTFTSMRVTILCGHGYGKFLCKRVELVVGVHKLSPTVPTFE